jgi:hypothetical protein
MRSSGRKEERGLQALEDQKEMRAAVFDRPLLFVFVDGLGLGSAEVAVNPLADTARFPVCSRILAESAPLDPCMGVPGLPQSATGQAALLTGLNAAQRMGRHIEGFPPPRLKTLVREHNIFKRLKGAGLRCTFANAYWLEDVRHIPPRRESVTTVATLSALGAVRGKAELLADQAVCHDLTRRRIKTDRGYCGPLITPEAAAAHLTRLAEQHDFTLFEFFETDRAGHRADRAAAEAVLDKLERFFNALQSFSGLLLVTSDHGNIEDLTVRTHTANPVPLFCAAPEFVQRLNRIEELTPALLAAFGVPAKTAL